jgi:hemoglobin-like flavoprotein
MNASVTPLTRFVLAYRRRLIGWRIARVGFIVAVAVLSFVAILQAIFAFFPWTLLPLLFDTVVALSMVLFPAYSAAAFTVWAPRLATTARSIEARRAKGPSFLSLALELDADLCSRDNPFTHATIARAVADLPSYPRSPSPPRHRVLMGASVLCLGLWCVTSPLLTPKLIDYWDLPLTRYAQREVTVSPGTITVRTGDAVDLVLDLKGAKYPSSRLSIVSPGGGKRTNLLLRPDANGFFRRRLDSVTTTQVYRFSPGALSLEPETLTVAPRPRLRGLVVTVSPPAYTKKPSVTLAQAQGNFDAYIGSRARIAITSSRLARARIICGRDSVPLAVKGDDAVGELVVNGSTAYTFSLLDTLGQKNDSLPLFYISAIPDDPPIVQIVKPGFNKALDPEQVETLHVEGIDDIGILAMALKWRPGGERAGQMGRYELPVKGVAALASVNFIWRLAELSLYPGDTVYYWAEVIDTKPGGTKRPGISDTFWFRIPSFQERLENAAETRDRAEKTIGAVRDKQGEIGRELENVVKAAAKKNELSWEQKQILRDVKKAVEAQSDSLAQALQSLQKNIEQLKQEGSIGEEIAKKFDDVRKAVEELTKQYGDSLLFALKEIEKPVSWKEMRAAVEKVQSLLPKMEEELDNVLKFLAMLKQDRKLAELAMRAEQLSKEQSALSKSDRSPEAKMDRQSDLLEAIKQLEKDAAGAAQSQEADRNSLDSLQSKQRLDSLSNAMRSRLSQRRMPTGESMNQMSGSLLSLSQDLMQMMNFNLAGRLEQERKALLSLSSDALMLADWQKELQHDAEASSGDPAARARGEQALKDALRKSMADADNLSMVPPDQMLAIGRGYKEALSSVEEVIAALGSSDGSSAMSTSGASLQSLANSLLSALSNLENGQQSSCGGGACMMPGLRKLSGRQAAINSMTADLLRQMLMGSQGMQPGGEGSSRESEQARQAAQQAQQAIADQLKDLAEQYGKEAGEGMRSRVGGLEEEARRMAALLSRPTAEITERQDRFLARMLETTLSMHRQGEGKEEWKSRTAEKTMSEQATIEPGKALRDIDAFHRLRQKAFGGNFPEGYRAALRAYFEALSERYLK